jgi:hypothetical protein
MEEKRTTIKQNTIMTTETLFHQGQQQQRPQQQ